MEIIGVADEYAIVVFESHVLERPGRSTRSGGSISSAPSPNPPAPRTSRLLARAPCHLPATPNDPALASDTKYCCDCYRAGLYGCPRYPGIHARRLTLAFS